MKTLSKINDPAVKTETYSLEFSGGVQLFVKVLTGPSRSGRRAMYIHGGGSGGNHTLVERPSRHLIADGFFDQIILPDRRGDGASSPMDHPLTLAEHAADMRAILDRLDIPGPLTALGISYGGPIALTLAQTDPRIERVVLVASSPTLNEVNGAARFLLKTGLLTAIMKVNLKLNLGKLPPQQVDFDPAYDASSPLALVRLYNEALKRTPKQYLNSMLYALQATLDPANASIPQDSSLPVPVIQIIGEGDEVWGTQIPDSFRQRIPNFSRYHVAGATIHKHCLLKPAPFYEKLALALREQLV